MVLLLELSVPLAESIVERFPTPGSAAPPVIKQNGDAATFRGQPAPLVNITQHKYDILFRSCEGLSLPAEICLKIVEGIIDEDPKTARVLMILSKAFYSLLRIYQYSIVKTASVHDGVNYPTILVPSWPRKSGIWTRSFPWLCEVRFRSFMIECLIQHAVTDMTQSTETRVLEFPVLDVPKSEFSTRVSRLKKDAMHYMFGLVDSTAKVPWRSTHQIRAVQCEYLDSLCAVQLAVLGMFVKVLGLGYFRARRANHPEKNTASIRDDWVVFEDQVLRHGPFFVLAVVIEKGEIHAWAQSLILQGLIHMEAFETGRTMAYASLQSVVWKLFCKKAECEPYDSWNAARQMVEAEMMRYEV